jgi:charged multivesicular body protein 2B
MRDTDRQLRKTGREIDRDRRELEKEEKKLVRQLKNYSESEFNHFIIQEMEIKNAAKTGNKQACTVLAKQLVQIRKQKERTYAANSKVCLILYYHMSFHAAINKFSTYLS